MDKARGKIIWVVVFVGVFSFLFIAHPLILSDADDWYYASYWRRPLPIFGSFNSIKVFPETFLPLCSMIASYMVMPFTKNYIMSLAFVYGIVGAVFITVYVYFVARLVECFAECRRILADIVGMCFLILHFLIYKNEWGGNVHLLWAHDVTCFFHYTLSVLLASCVVLYFMREETVKQRCLSLEVAEGKYDYFKFGILILILYLAVFSNSFNNIILTAFCGAHVLRQLIEIRHIRECIKKCWIHVAEIAAWLVAVFFQMFDLRNDNAKAQGMSGNMTGAIRGYVYNFISINKMAILFFIIVVFAFTANVLVEKLSQNKDVKDCGIKQSGVLFEIMISFVVVSIYLILLSGVASPDYITRPDVKIGIFFYLLLAVALMMGYLVRDSRGEENAIGIVQKLAMAALPILAFVLISQSLNYCKSYRDFNMSGSSYEQELEIDEGLIEQFKAADSNGATEFDLIVPYNAKASDNWPYPDYSGDLIRDALFRHGVISRPITARTVFDK